MRPYKYMFPSNPDQLTEEVLDAHATWIDTEEIKNNDNNNSIIAEQPSEGDVEVAKQLIAAIKDEWEAIEFYNSLADLLRKTPYKEMLEVVEDIAGEENIHVGQLERLLKIVSPNVDKIKEGEKETEEQIQDQAEESEDEELLQEGVIEETYTDDELDKLVGKTFNLQKIDNIYRRKKYGEDRLFAHTVCTKCGREKKVFLSNLVNDPEKYGSCVCSDTNVDAKIDNIQSLYDGSKKIASNTSGYTGVTFIKSYRGQPYKKWRAYIDIDGTRVYLGDFSSKAKAIKARKEAGENGIKWYNQNRGKLIRDVRRKTKKYKTSKYRDSAKKRITLTRKKKK